MVLPRSMRLKGHRCFDHIHRFGKRYHGSLMILRVAKSKPILQKSSFKDGNPTACKCAVAISNKVSKKAVVRNRLRRLIHNHLRERLFQDSAQIKNWLLISLKPKSSDKSTCQLLEECDQLLDAADLLL